MTFEELVELRSLIDEQLMTLYPDYNFILNGGDYCFDSDLELEKFFSKPFSTYNQPQSGWKSGWNKKKKTSETAHFQGFLMEVPPGFGPGNEGFADLCLTTWLWHHKNGAVDETRTRDLHLGKVALYQLSYYRLYGALGRN